MDVTYNNVLESTRQYFQGVPPAASGLSHAGQHPAGAAHALFNSIPPGGQQQPNGSNYYHHQQALHQQQLQQQSLQQHQQQQQQQHQQQSQQRHPPAQQQQPQSQPVPSYLTNGAIGAVGKNMYPPQPSPSPQEGLRIPPSATTKNHYSNHPNPSPSPQEHRLPSGNATKSMYSPHPQPSPSPQDHVRLPSMSPFSNLPYQNQMQGASRNRHTPTSASPLPPISQLKGPPSSPSPSAAAAAAAATGYQRQVNGAAGHYGANPGYYHPSYNHQSLLQQQRDLQQQHQQLQQQLHQQQQEELKQHLQQQAFYSSLTNSSQQHQSTAHQAQLQRRTPTQYPQNSRTPSRSPATSAAGVNLSRNPSNASTAGNAAAVVKRESPLDLSVKTVRQSADSTGQMENNSSESGTTYYYFQQEGVRGPLPLTSNQQQSSYQSYATLQPATTPKVDFSPNFSQHAHSLHNHQQQQQQQQNHQPQVQQLHQQSQHQPTHPHAAHHTHAQLLPSHLDKRWKDQFHLPQTASVLKTAPPASHASMPGTSGNVNHLSSHYHVNQFGQSLPKPVYPQEPSRYPQNYLKRPPSVDHSKVSAPTPPKQSRLDSWKATIDQQIEKRFNSYLSSKGIVNGDVGKVATSAPSPAPAPVANYPIPGRNFYDHQQGPPPQQQQQQQGHSAEKSSHLPPSTGNGAADKRVLSILRNSLETKEARLQQQQMVKSPLQYTELTSRPAASAHHLFAAQHRQSLPAFHGFSAAHERIQPSAFPRLSIPKAVDSIQEHHKSTSYLGAQHHPHLPPSMLPIGHAVPRQPNGGKHPEVVDITSEDEGAGMSRLLQGPKAASTPLPTSAALLAGAPSPALPTSKSGEFDGLAAFLAARIRTKAELKQQTPPDQPPTPGSSSLTSASLSSTNFRSPYSNDLVKTPGVPPDMLISGTSKSSFSAAFPRRRLFSKGEEEHLSKDVDATMGSSFPPATASLPPRTSSSHRSSSETSVFDFRESDSDGETPKLDRQPGRRPSVSGPAPGGSNSVHLQQQLQQHHLHQQQQPPPHREVIFPATPLEEELKPVDEDTYEDWLGYVDDLLGQLEKDRQKRTKTLPKKPSVRGARGGGRGAGMGEKTETKPILPPPTAIKQEPDTEDSSLQLAASSTIKEEPVEAELTPTKDTSQVNAEVKAEGKDKQRGSGGAKRVGRGRGRGGGLGSRGGRGGRSKKAVFGDGSDFRTPGWEEELYKFKKSLRMPARLINISRPPGWPKAPLSLPDLEAYPDSPCTNDSMETFPGKSKIEKDDNKKTNEEDKKSIAKSLGEDQSFLDRLMAKYTARKKKSKKDSPAKAELKDENGAPELLPTPSLHGSKDPSLLGFRKETIAEYRAEFLKTGTFTAEADLPPTILLSRTRTENKLFKERLTIKEVFGAERPASAPPPGTTTDDLRRRQRLRTNKQKEKKKRMMVRAKKAELRQNSGPGQGKNKTFRTFRRKLKSSGFDYIRKPKKKKEPGPKKDSDHPHKPRKKKVQPMTEEEIEETIKSWTLNKGIGETVLHRAAKNGLLDVVRYLVDKLEQDPSPRDNAGYTPLHEACSRGHVAVAQLLLNYGASVEDSALGGVRPLHEAAENGFTKVVRLLLDYGADPLLATYSGATALSLAAAEEESRLLMEQHLTQNGSNASSVHDDIASVPKEASLDCFEIEESDFPLPTLYRLSGESRVDSWVLFHELAPHVKVKTKEAFTKLLKADSSTVIREIKIQDFFAKAHSRAIKSAPPTECPNKTPKLTLVKYTDEIKDLLGVETTTVPR